MTGSSKPSELGPPFEAEYPDDGIVWRDENGPRLYESGQAAISDVALPLGHEVKLVVIEGLPPTDGTPTAKAQPSGARHLRAIPGPDPSHFSYDGQGHEVPHNLR